MEIKVAYFILVASITICFIGSAQWTKDGIKYYASFAKINNALRKKLPMEPTMEYPMILANIERARKLLNSARVRASPLKGGNLKKAYELFVSLDDTRNRCDRDSYTILIKNYYANIGSKLDYKSHDYERTRKVLRYYGESHGKFCLPKYKESFRRKFFLWLDNNSKERIERAFEGLSLEDFHPTRKDDADSMKPTALLTELVIDFKLESSSGAIKKILRQMKNVRKVYPVMLDTYLFTPCKNYREHLSEILISARIDVLLGGDGLDEIVNDDDAFRQAMINDMFCIKLLQDKEKLYEIFSTEWDRLSTSGRADSLRSAPKEDSDSSLDSEQ